MVYTRRGTERIIRYAFELAQKRGPEAGQADKPQVIADRQGQRRASAGPLDALFRRGQAAEYPGIDTDHAYIDAACMWMVKNPEWFDVGSDDQPVRRHHHRPRRGCSIGGMGIAASGNIHPGQVSMFEGIHGSAPDIAGKDVASPVATILALAMMLEHIGQREAKTELEATVESLLLDGRIKGLGAGDHRCSELGDLVRDELLARAGKR